MSNLSLLKLSLLKLSISLSVFFEANESSSSKLFSPSFASLKILTTLSRITIDSSGSLIDYDGKRIPF